MTGADFTGGLWWTVTYSLVQAGGLKSQNLGLETHSEHMIQHTSGSLNLYQRLWLVSDLII